MGNKQEKRTDETKHMILAAAKKLFIGKGYDSVSVREIAKEAGCSHTTIYLYFKDKEALLHQLSMPTLEDLYQNMQQIILSRSKTDQEKLQEISQTFIRFCLRNKNMYTIFINVKSSKVDEIEPKTEINKLRLKLFSLIKQALGNYLSIPDDDQLLAFSRIFFYNLYGIISTYSHQHEPAKVLLERLTPTIDLSVEILISGFKVKLNRSDSK